MPSTNQNIQMKWTNEVVRFIGQGQRLLIHAMTPETSLYNEGLGEDLPLQFNKYLPDILNKPTVMTCCYRQDWHTQVHVR